MGQIIGDFDMPNTFNKDSKSVKPTFSTKPFFAQQLEKKKVVKRK